MSLSVHIEKKLGKFHLRTDLEADNETLALLGASGCGKSLTLRCIAGILTPDTGRIVLNDRVLFDSERRINLPARQRGVGYLFQQYALFPNMTVSQNIAVAVREKSRRDGVVAEKLRTFRLEEVAGQKPAQLSGGQQQRVALARILASEPAAVLLDEPFSALDSYLKYQLELELTDTIANFPGPVLWVSHDRGEVRRNCGRVCVMDQGKSEPIRTMEELFRNPGTEAAARLSGCKNYADAIPKATGVELPQWGITLDCGTVVDPRVIKVGVRSHHVRPAGNRETNTFYCTVERMVEDVFEIIVLLRPQGAGPDAPLLRMELGKQIWPADMVGKQVEVAISPQDILLLQ